jgi:chromosome segregation ATPase
MELANVRRDADEVEQTTSYYLDQLLADGQEIEALKKEHDGLRQREDEARERACELLSSAEKDRELKLAMETKLAAAEAQACQDASTLVRIRKERDDLRLTVGRLRSEHEMACGERNVARHQVVTLQAELEEEQN